MIILTAVRVAIGLVFLAAAVGKLRHPRRFATALKDYLVGPFFSPKIVATLIIAAEFALAATHLSGIGLTVSAPMGVGLLVAFAAIVGRRLARGDGGPCLCFGVERGEDLSHRTLLRLCVLLGGECAVGSAVIWGSDRATIITAITAADVMSLAAWVVLLLAAAMLLLRYREYGELVRGTIRASDV